MAKPQLGEQKGVLPSEEGGSGSAKVVCFNFKTPFVKGTHINLLISKKKIYILNMLLYTLRFTPFAPQFSDKRQILSENKDIGIFLDGQQTCCLLMLTF